MKVSQETFDSIVSENVEEFELSLHEARKEAVEQLKRQGADLSEVDISGGTAKQDARTEMEKAVQVIAGASKVETARNTLLAALMVIQAVSKNEQRQAALSAFGIKDGSGALAALLQACVPAEIPDWEVLSATLIAWRQVIIRDDTARDAFRWRGGAQSVVAAMRYAAKNNNDDCRIAALELIAAAATRCESNKGALAKAGVCSDLAKALVTKNDNLLKSAARAVCTIAAADDTRSATSASFDTSRALVDAGAVEALIQALKVIKNSSDLLVALRQLAKSDEAVKRIIRNGGAAICADIIDTFCFQDTKLAIKAVGLLRNLAANDDAKDRICSDGTLDALFKLALHYPRETLLIEHTLATIAQIALRKPSNAIKILNKSGIQLILDAMRNHPTHAATQRQACLAIRNLVARLGLDALAQDNAKNTAIQGFLDDGAEDLLRKASTQSSANVDVAYAALRDLGISVQISTYELGQDGRGELVPKAHFGDKANVNFRPVFGASDDIDDKISQADAQGSAPLTAFSLM
uniref:Armadillo repeat-containing protein 6 n=1 Tax=Aureoumbra lagunensis TaxID=44058 RepID=A0A7S3JNE3_9STRA|mmetsp:Transcript_15829/g.23811  ORF Transcript_15829/g.23811 Transcript_15829/m.23811 type:complete len:524 (+) Transcript_15829:86-1657(+)